jgi:hypothetical protein
MWTHIERELFGGHLLKASVLLHHAAFVPVFVFTTSETHALKV